MSSQRWADLLPYRPKVPPSDSLSVPQRLPMSLKQNLSPLLDRYLTYFLLNSQAPSSPMGYQDPTHLRSSQHYFTATHTRPDGTRRLVYHSFQGRPEAPLPIQWPSDSQRSWAELRKKLPRESLDSSLADDVLDSSERIERMSKISEDDQDQQPESWKEDGRILKGSLGKPSMAEIRSAPEVQSLGEAQSLAGVLEKYGVDLRQLSESQLEQLSVLLQLMQSDALQKQGARKLEKVPLKRVSEGEMQHTAQAEPQYSAPELSSREMSEAPEAIKPDQRTPEEIMSATTATITTHLVPDAQTMVGQPVHQAAGSAEGDVRNPEKKSFYEGPEISVVPGQSPQRATEDYGYILTDQNVSGSAVTFKIGRNHQNLTTGEVADRAVALKSDLQSETGVKIVQSGTGQRSNATTYPHVARFGDTFRFVVLIFIALACIAGIVIASTVIFCIRQHAKQREKERLAGLGPEAGGDSTYEYQDLCRQHMAGKSLFGRTEGTGAAAENSRVSSVSSQFSDVPQPSPSSHSSTPSWCEEPVQSNMDISTGHMILAYMEDHLRNRDRLAKEWQALCAYQAEPNACSIAKTDANLKKNRNPDFVPYDHARIKLRSDNNPSRSDYINASPIIEHDPRMPTYIATQGPLSHTIADFWQMVWENGCTVIVMMTPLVEDGVKQCDRYWPDEGSSLYHIYEVNLVSEHIWCEDFLVRSFYLKNVQTQETRTLTQFHFLSWPAEGIPSSTRPLLDFRRKVNKSFRGRSCPIIVHCSDGVGRTGTYILIDMVLNRMAKGVKEIDIAASLEHVRDQRPGMVRTKDQFEFALTAVAEEVNAILKALPQ
ncbi:receptor-type tyrosine-protein phosphatase-like N isoform 1-T1 [Gastrophryne carolinensis]